MKTTLKVQLCMAALACAAGGAMFVASGCELVTDFDRSLIDAGALDLDAEAVTEPPFDGNFDGESPFADGSTANAGDAGDAAITDATDATDDAAALDASDAANATDAADATDAALDADAAG